MRNIPLKEHPPNSHGRYLPSHKDREASDETLGGGPFVGRGTADGYLYTGNERPDAVKNLIMLGGSFVESLFVEERSRFPSIIERSLPDAWRVLNGGQSEM